MRLRVGKAITIVVICATILLSKPDAQSTLMIGYALGEGSGAVAADGAGSNESGALVNAPTWTSPGRFGGGLLFNGTSQYLRTNSPNLPTGDFTWALWINRGSSQAFQTLLEAQGTTVAELELNLENGALTIWSSGAHRFTTTSVVPANTWTHIALTRAGGILRAYINGVADQRTGTDSRILNFASCPLLLGVDADSGCTGLLNGYLQAEIDEVQIHSRALSAAEIQQMMGVPLGGGGPVPDTTAPVRSTSQPNITAPAGTTQLSISLTTNESATCRHELTPGVVYASMSGLFSSTGSTTHTYIVSGLSDGTTRTYHIKCQDAAANANTDDFLITVTVAQPGPPPPPPPPPSNATFYVAPAGDDQNPGTFEQPFRTIDRARQAVRGVNGSMTTDIRVVLRGGEYSVPSTIAFGPLDSGSNGHDVIYDAYPGERPVLHGGQHVTGWTAVGGGIYKAQVGALRFRQLYVNGQRAVRARTPNAGAYNQVVFWDTANRRVEVGAGEVASWQRLNQVEMIILGAGVNQSNLRISSVSGSVVTPLEPERTRIFQQSYPPKGPGRPYYFENALEFLDTPGEWYLNTDTGEVHYRPRPGEDLATADVVVPRLERLLSVTGTLSNPVRHIQFRNLTFAYSTWLLPNTEGFVGDQASVIFLQPLPDDEISSYPGGRHPAAVHVEAADNVTFERNVFSHLGSSGLNLYASTHDNRVIGNVFTDISASGISVGLDLLGNPADPRQVSSGAVIQNNYLSETGVEFYQTVGIMVAYGDSTLIEHNELSKMPYSGITVGWGWANEDNAARNNLIRHNEIHDVLRMMSDGGGIYTLSRQPGTFISDNYVHDIVRTGVQGGFNISGIYLDEGSSQITVRDNVLQNTGDRRTFQNGNGPNNVLANNDGQSPATMANAGLEAAYEDIRPGSPPPPPPPPPPPADTTPPVRSNGQPSGTLPAGTTQTTLSLSTDENATCRYSTTAGVAYGSMPSSFATTGGTVHSTTVTGLTNGSSYTYFVRCADGAANANTTDLAIAFSVGQPADTTPPVRSNGQPSGTLPAGTTQTTLSLSTNENATCRYSTTAGAAYSSMPSSFATTGGTAHSTTVTGLTNGSSYTYFVRCVDGAANANTNDFAIAFSVAVALPADTTPPVRSNGQPTGTLPAGTTQTMLILSTDENATCRYSTTAGVAYGSMPSTFATTGGTTHSTTVTGLTNGSSYNYFVRCVDGAANANTTDLAIAFSVATPPPPPTSGLVAAYGFNEGTGTTTADASGNSHTGAIAGASWITQGRFGNALSFDGLNDWVTAADANALDLTTGMTLEAWVYPTTGGAAWRNVVIKERPGGETYNLYAHDTSVASVYVVRSAAPNTPLAAKATAALPLNTWSHLAATYNGSTLRLYLNGTQVGTRTMSGALVTSSGVLRIGGNSIWGEFFAGRIDEVRIYNRALTQAEIQADMNRPVQ